MKPRLLVLLGAILVVSSGWWVFLADPGRIPLVDFNRQVLAETESEARCTGETLIMSDLFTPNPEPARACRAASDYSDEVDRKNVPRWFCEAVKAANDAPWDVQTGCIDVLSAQRWWPTINGSLSDAFDGTKGYPYPGDLLFQQPTDNESRTGSREGFTRDEGE